LIKYLLEHGDLGAPLEIIDLGAGTGANQRWLAPRLPFPQRWTHLDHDPLISRVTPLPAETVIMDAAVDALAALLASSSGGQHLVTCSALLDVLTADQIEVVCRAVINSQVPALFSLTVTGTMSLTPAVSSDQQLLAAFNDHQRRAERVGPDATGIVAHTLRTAGFRVHTQQTPWLLTASSDFVDQFLWGRLDAAMAQDLSLTSTAPAWFELRRSQLALGILRIEVGHLDILALPR
jgi:hypothetical protein